MQSTGIDGEQAILLIEGHQLVEPEFLELINSLLCSGDVPGLYTSEELDPLLVPLRDQASQDGFRGPIYTYFAQRVLCNLHVVLILDCSSADFILNCEANPALYKCCSFQWLDGWSKSSMLKSKFYYNISFYCVLVINSLNVLKLLSLDMLLKYYIHITLSEYANCNYNLSIELSGCIMAPLLTI